MKEESLSLPSRECGLKYPASQLLFCPRIVTPFAGVWIEMVRTYK